jgi:hypothetical protein
MMPSPWANRLYRDTHEGSTTVNYHSTDKASADIRAIQREGFEVIGGNPEGLAAFERAAKPEPRPFGPALPRVRITDERTGDVFDTDAGVAAKRLAASVMEPEVAAARFTRDIRRLNRAEDDFEALRLDFLAEFLIGASFARGPVEYANVELGTWPA